MTPKLQHTHQQLHTPKTGDGRILFHPILMMHTAHLYGYTYEQFMCERRVLVETNLRAHELYDHDAVSTISDPYRETSAFGAAIHFDGDYAPRADILVHTMEDVDRLSRPDVYAAPRTLDRILSGEMFRKALGPHFPVIGWVEGPMAEASDLMGMSELMMNAMLDPDMVKALTAKTLQTAMDFAEAQIKAGANIIGVGDAICSQISPKMYGEFCHEGHRELFSHIHSLGALVKVHICGDISHILQYLAQEDIDILDIDWMVDMRTVHEAMGPDVMICGNLDPVSVMLNGNKALILEKFLEAKVAVPAENWILMAGCEIPMYTPQENMKYLREISMKS